MSANQCICNGYSKTYNHDAALEHCDKPASKENSVNHTAKRVYEWLEKLKSKQGTGGKEYLRMP